MFTIAFLGGGLTPEWPSTSSLSLSPNPNTSPKSMQGKIVTLLIVTKSCLY